MKSTTLSTAKHRSRRAWILAAAITAGLAAAGAAPLNAADEPARRQAEVQAELAVADAVAPSCVRVEITLKFDNGQPPTIGAWGPGRGERSYDAQEYVQDERPLEVSATMVSPTLAITSDIAIHPRFIAKVAIRRGGAVVPAHISAVGKSQNVMLVEAEKPLENAKPLEFNSTSKGPYFNVTFAQKNGEWVIAARPLSLGAFATVDKRHFVDTGAVGLVVDDKGAGVGLSGLDEMPADDSWKGSPLKWAWIKSGEMDKMLGTVEKSAASGLVRVGLSFRSPRAGADPRAQMMMRSNGEDENATERSVLGVLTSDKRILVLASLIPSQTGRLQRITVFQGEKEGVAAKFEASLKDYACFTATLEKPLAGAFKLATGDLTAYRDKLLAQADVKLQGETRTAHYMRARVSGFEEGFKGRIFPGIVGGTTFAVDFDGTLFALPIPRREKAESGREYRYDSGPLEVPAAYIAEAVADIRSHADPNNRPLTEEEENRLAWIGVEMQGLNRDLARANNVAEQTSDGETGGLITYVYPDSPAAKAGVKPDWILLRIHVEEMPKPIDVHVDPPLFDGPFPWDRYDQAPEQAFERIPTPWMGVETPLTRTLTDIGFGKKFTADFFHDGKLTPIEMTTTQSPTHYGSAPKYKCIPAGLTVKDMTYEVRRYFKRKPEDPGVVISKIELGSKASVFGLKPYEIITQVNDTPVANIEEFKKAVEGKTELRMQVRRMINSHLITVKLDDKDMKPDADPKKD